MLDDRQRTVATSRRRLAAVIASGLTVAAAAVVAIVGFATHAAQPSIAHTGAASPAPQAVVPWVAASFEPYTPGPLLTATATPAPICRLRDLREQPPTTAAGTGNEAIVFSFVNVNSHACLTGGYPHVVLSQPGQPDVVPTPGGFWDNLDTTSPSDLQPGATARFLVGFTTECDQPFTGLRIYKHATATLPGGGSFSQTFSGIAPYSAGLPMGVFAQCPVSVTQLAGPVPPPVFPADPLLSLVPAIRAPASVGAGQVIRYTITLSNPTQVTVALSPCRGYFETLHHLKGPGFAYDLNCAAARPIPAGGSEVFAMEIPTGGFTAGSHVLCWNLDDDGASRAPICSTVRITA